MKTLAVIAPLLLGSLWYVQPWHDDARVVDRSPAEVMRALADLDLREQPGSPGTDPARSGGVTPRFVTERGDNRISFVVMSGNRVATRMTAVLEPLDGGRRTRVTTSVERGDAPGALISPAFRSTGVTEILFLGAVNDEIEEMLAPPRRSEAFCEALMRRLAEANMGTGVPDQPEGFVESFAGAARDLRRVRGWQAELRRSGCPTSGENQEIRPIRSQMGTDLGPTARPDGTTFEPGQPMMDVGRESSR
jgi:hypothetical protein